MRHDHAASSPPRGSNPSAKVLLLPGLDGTGELYDEFRAALPRHVSLEALSYPRDQVLGYEGLAELVRARLPTDERWFLLGESFSGPLALRLAAERPAGLAGLILVATFHRKPVALPAWMVPTFAFRVSPPSWLIRHLMFEPGVGAEAVDAFMRAIESVGAETLANRAREALRVDESPRSSAIEVPILYLRAESDRLFDANVHASLARLLPAMETQVIAHAPHLVLQRRPREAAQVITRWMRDASPASLA